MSAAYISKHAKPEVEMQRKERETEKVSEQEKGHGRKGLNRAYPEVNWSE